WIGFVIRAAVTLPLASIVTSTSPSHSRSSRTWGTGTLWDRTTGATMTGATVGAAGRAGPAAGGGVAASGLVDTAGVEAVRARLRSRKPDVTVARSASPAFPATSGSLSRVSTRSKPAVAFASLLSNNAFASAYALCTIDGSIAL